MVWKGLSEVPMLRLRGPRGGQAPLEHGLIVGRGALGLSSPKISRKHVEVLKDGDRWQVRRLAPNPAKLRRAEGGEDIELADRVAVELREGDRLWLGSHESLEAVDPAHVVAVVDVTAPAVAPCVAGCVRLKGPASELPLRPGLVVGRGEALGLSSPRISRKHVQVLRDGGRWLVKRLAANPAKLRRAEGGEDIELGGASERPTDDAVELREGDRLWLGSYEALEAVDAKHVVEVVAAESKPAAAGRQSPATAETPPTASAPPAKRAREPAPASASAACEPEDADARPRQARRIDEPAASGGAELSAPDTAAAAPAPAIANTPPAEIKPSANAARASPPPAEPAAKPARQAPPAAAAAAASPAASVSPAVRGDGCSGMHIVLIEKGLKVQMYLDPGKAPRQHFKKAGGTIVNSRDQQALPRGTTHVVTEGPDWARAVERYPELPQREGQIHVMSREWLAAVINAITRKKPLPSEDAKDTSKDPPVPYSLWPREEECSDSLCLAAAIIPLSPGPNPQDSQSQGSLRAGEFSSQEDQPAGLGSPARGAPEREDKMCLIIQKLEELEELMEFKGVGKEDTQWRQMSSRRVAKCLREYQMDPDYKPVHNAQQIVERRRRRERPWFGGEGMKGDPNKTDSPTFQKFKEILETGNLARIEDLKNDSRVQAKMQLGEVWDIGHKLAEQLYSEGYHTREELRYGVPLSVAQKRGLSAAVPSAVEPNADGETRLTRCACLGLKYHDELQQRVPREEIAAAVEVTRQAVESIMPEEKRAGLRVEGVGSFRRGKKSSGDIDILITHTDGQSHHKVNGMLLMPQIEAKLREMDMIKEKLKYDEDGWNKEGPGAHTHTRQPKGQKYMGLCHVPGFFRIMRHLDLFTFPDESWGTALMHSTGSDLHNRSMRHWAQQLDLTLSEKALAPTVRSGSAYKETGEYTNNKAFVGEPLTITCERDVYDTLGLVYKEPAERTGRVTHKEMVDWDCAFVLQFARFVGLAALPSDAQERVMTNFKRAGVDGRALVEMNADGLRELGLTDVAQIRGVLEQRNAAARGDRNPFFKEKKRRHPTY